MSLTKSLIHKNSLQIRIQEKYTDSLEMDPPNWMSLYFFYFFIHETGSASRRADPDPGWNFNHGSLHFLICITGCTANHIKVEPILTREIDIQTEPDANTEMVSALAALNAAQAETIR